MATLIQAPELYGIAESEQNFLTLDRFPTAKVFDNVDAWLRDGVTCIGASESPALLGYGYADQSIISLYEAKINPRFDDDDERELFEWGHAIQPVTLAMFSRKAKVPVQDLGPFTRIRHPLYPWLACTLDGFTEDPNEGPGVVEAKNIGHYSRKEWEADDPPLRVQIQIQHQIACTDTTHGYAVACVGGNKLAWRKVERNEDFIAALIAECGKFWGYVTRRELPPVDESAATAAALGRLWPEDSGATVFGPPEAANWMRELEEAKEAIKAQEARKMAAENQLKAALGEATFIEAGGCRYSWKQQSRKGYFVEPVSFRVLRRCK